MKDVSLQEQLEILLNERNEAALIQFISAIQMENLNLPREPSIIKRCAYLGMTQAARQFSEKIGISDLFEAAILGEVDKITEIAETGFDMNSFGEDGFTALGLACYFSQTEAVKWLITLGADLETASKNEMKVTPIHAAVASGNATIVQILLEKGANPNVQQSNGATPLHAAVFSNNLTITEQLIQYKASTNIAMQDGKTPVDLALELNHAEILRLLKEKGQIY